MRVLIVAAIAPTLVAALGGCSAAPKVTQGYGLLDFGDICAPKRAALPAEIPTVAAAGGYGTLTGVVLRDGTALGVDSIGVNLSIAEVPPATHAADAAVLRQYRSRVTGQTGGFTFDSIVPGKYRLRFIGAWERPESVFVAVAADRIDTVRMAMHSSADCPGP